MRICNLLLILGAFGLFLYIREKVKKYSVKATILKAIESVLFISVAVCAWYFSESCRNDIIGIFIILGLVCGLLGDIWLDLKYVFRNEDSAFTYAGFASFAVGHIFYICGLLSRFYQPDMLVYVLIPATLALICSFGNGILEKALKLKFGNFRPVVIAYGALLFSTLFLSSSFAIYYSWQNTTLILFFAGAVLFTLSDLILSGTFFGIGKERPIDLILNYITYYPAQFLIAYSLLF